MKSVESLGNVKKYLEPINTMQLAAIQTKRMLMSGGGSMPAPPAPAQKTGGSSRTLSEPEPKSSQMAAVS